MSRSLFDPASGHAERNDVGAAADAQARPSWDGGPGSIVRVAVPMPPPAEGVYDYVVPNELRGQVAVGRRVTVPLGRRQVHGTCVELAEGTDVPAERLREAIGLPDDEPLFDEEMLALARWIAEYYACNWGEVLAAAVPAGVRHRVRRRDVVRLALGVPREEAEQAAEELAAQEATAKQAKVLRTLLTFEEPFTPSALARRLGITLSPIRTLARRGLVLYRREKVGEEEPFDDGAEPDPPEALSDEQGEALTAVCSAIDAGGFRPFLLQGVTGSGKTEVYLRAIQHALALGKGAIVLVPEISLTPQTQRRFMARMDGVAVFHSGLTDRERHLQWLSVKRGERRVVIGPRSALFAPVRDLGLIVVDEEHEPSYKQHSTPRYHARDVAVQRALMTGCAVLLGSATPSMESRLNAESGKYGHLRLTRRVADRPMPAVSVVDMSFECAEQKRFAVLSRKLEDELGQCVHERGEQAILFLNRRGFHTFMQCTACGHVAMCRNCDVSMTYHRKLNKLVCHYCYETAPATPHCPACHEPTLRYSGYGTQQIEDVVRQTFPTFRVARMDSDSMTTRRHYEQTLRDFREGDLDVLIGTQMIGKGLDFPGVTLVGVISADGALSMPDFRARERTFQLVAQVAGRAGRGEKAGRVIVQTFHVDEPAVVLATRHDFESFFRREIRDRHAAFYPPFCRLVQITAEGESQEKVERALADWAARLRDVEGLTAQVRLLGPAPAALALLRGKVRWQLLAKARNSRAVRNLVGIVRDWKAPAGVKTTIDVDAIDMM